MTNFNISDNYICIQGWMIQKLGLKGTELLVYAIIYGFTQDGDSKFTGTISYLRSWTQTSDTNIVNILSNLVTKNYIIKEIIPNTGMGNKCHYWVNPDIVRIATSGNDIESYNKVVEPPQESCITHTTNLYNAYNKVVERIQESCINNINNNINNNIEKNIVDMEEANPPSNPFEVTQKNKLNKEESSSKNKRRKRASGNTSVPAPGANWQCEGMRSTNTEKLSILTKFDNELARKKKQENEDKEANELSPLEKKILKRQKELTPISRQYFDNEEIITQLNRFIYNMMEITSGAKIGTNAWVEQLEELKQKCKSDDMVIDVVKFVIRGNYKKLFVPDSYGVNKNGCQWDNTRGVDRPKELSEMSTEEREEFTNTLATDDDGNLLSF